MCGIIQMKNQIERGKISMKLQAKYTTTKLHSPFEVFIGETEKQYVSYEKNSGMIRTYDKSDWEVIDLGADVGDIITIRVSEPIKN